MARNYIPKTWDGLASQVARDVCNKVGKKIAKDMTKQYISAIKRFYGDYHPRAYKRKYRSYYFADPYGLKAYTRFVKMDGDGKGFTVRLNVAPDNVKVNYTSLKNGKGSAPLTEIVFTNTWVLGRHGGNLPYDVIPEALRVTNGLYENGWRSRKNTGWTWIPEQAGAITSPSPMEMMDAWFESYATNENLDRLTRDIVTASINSYITKARNKHGEIK